MFVYRRFAGRVGMPPPLAALTVGFAVLLSNGCGGYGAPTINPTPTPAATPMPGLSTDVVVGPRTGPTEITFVAAEPPPGSTVTGCGPNASGCSGRVRMRFRLRSASGGPVLRAVGFLHATSKLACYRGSTGRLELQPGVPTEVVIVFDQPDSVCGMPVTIANMKVVLSAPVEVEALQEWAIQYELRP